MQSEEAPYLTVFALEGHGPVASHTPAGMKKKLRHYSGLVELTHVDKSKPGDWHVYSPQ